jgi:glycosyltransferase involved in cell wall biosynthesis
MSRRMIRVAYLTGLRAGGSERQIVELAQRLPRDRFQVGIIAFGNRSALFPAAEAAADRLAVLGRAHREGPARTPAPILALRSARLFARYLRAVRAGHYDIVDARLFHGYVLAGLTKPLAGVPILVAGRRSLGEFKERFGPLERGLDRLARRVPDVIVANSAAVAADTLVREHLDPTRLRVIRNGLSPAQPLAPGERDAIRAGWGFGPDDIVAGAVANYRTVKGLDRLIRVVAGLHTELPALRLVLIGDGPLRGALEAQAAELGISASVRVNGPEPDARRLVEAFDLVVAASEAEGLPNALLEAAAAGRPIAATAAGGTVEVVEDGRTGLLVPVGDEVALAGAVRRLVQDPELRARLGAAAREHVEATFGMDRMVAEYADLYTELAERRGLGR